MEKLKIYDVIAHLSYEGCKCMAEYKPELHIINGKCKKHGGRLLLHGEPIEEHRKRVRDKVRNFFGLT